VTRIPVIGLSGVVSAGLTRAGRNADDDGWVAGDDMRNHDAVPLSEPSRQPRVERGDAWLATGRRWYVVYSKPHKEETACSHLKLRGVEVFYPRIRRPVRAGAHREIVGLFPRYLFVRLSLATQFQDVVWAPGVSRFVGAYGAPTPIEDGIVDSLRENVDGHGFVQVGRKASIGQHVEITGGPFAGLVGIILREPNAKGRIRLLARLLSRRTIEVDVPLSLVETGWTLRAPATRPSCRHRVASAGSARARCGSPRAGSARRTRRRRSYAR
jgi:transcriptional antiterminator RfaH